MIACGWARLHVLQQESWTWRKGSHQLEDAGNPAIRTVYLLRTATPCFSLHASLEFHGGKVVDLAHDSPPCLRIACFASGWILWHHTSITWPCLLGHSCWDHRDFWPMPHQPISFWEVETGTEIFQLSMDSLVELKEDREPGVVRGSHLLPDGQGGWFREKWRGTIWKKYRCSSVVTFHLCFNKSNLPEDQREKQSQSYWSALQTWQLWHTHL